MNLQASFRTPLRGEGWPEVTIITPFCGLLTGVLFVCRPASGAKSPKQRAGIHNNCGNGQVIYPLAGVARGQIAMLHFLFIMIFFAFNPAHKETWCKACLMLQGRTKVR